MKLKEVLLEELAEIMRQNLEEKVYSLLELPKESETQIHTFEIDNIRAIALQKKELELCDSRHRIVKRRLLLDHSKILENHLEGNVQVFDLCESVRNLIVETLLVKSLSTLQSDDKKVALIPPLVNLMNIAGLWSLKDKENKFKKFIYPNLFCLSSGEKLSKHGYFKKQENSADKKNVKDSFKRKSKTARKNKSFPGSYVLNSLLDDYDTVENYIAKNSNAFSYFIKVSEEKSIFNEPISNTQHLNKSIKDFIDIKFLNMHKKGIITINYISFIDDLTMNPEEAYKLFGIYVNCDLDLKSFADEFVDNQSGYDYRKIIGVEYRKIKAYINELINNNFKQIYDQITIVEPEKLNLKMFQTFE